MFQNVQVEKDKELLARGCMYYFSQYQTILGYITVLSVDCSIIKTALGLFATLDVELTQQMKVQEIAS